MCLANHNNIIIYKISEMKNEQLIGQRLSSFTFIKKLGEGAWAKVYEAIDEKGKETVAVKSIRKQLMKDTPKLQELVKTEIKVLRGCKNQNVIRFVSSFQSKDSIFIATEFCNGGDLEKYLEQKKSLSQDQATTFLKQILNGFKGLHQVGAMHRDFKTANVLLHNGVCKIADLGFAKQMQKQKTAETILGTSVTMAPQVLAEEPYSFEADIWSIGVVFYQMLYGKYPYFAKTQKDILKQIKNHKPKYDGVNLSKQARSFLERCLTIDPKQRISWENIYDHQLLNKKQQGSFIYGTLKSRISMNSNKDFYRKNKLPEKNSYPDLDRSSYDVKEIVFEDIGNDMGVRAEGSQVIEEVKQKKKKEDAFQRFEQIYINHRNDCMFVFKFVAPFVNSFYNVRANHAISLFIMSKKAYLDLKFLLQSMEGKKNIFKFAHYFEQFTTTNIYRRLLDQFSGDLSLVKVQTESFRFDIEICSEQIVTEFDIDHTDPSNFENLVIEKVKEYWFLLAQALMDQKVKNRENLIKVLEALSYFKKDTKTRAEQFDRMMTVIDYEEAQKGIVSNYSEIYN